MHALRLAKPVTTVQASAAVCSFARFHISQAHSAHPADARVNTARMTATIVVAKVRNPMPRSLAEVGPSSRRQQGKFLDTTSGAHGADGAGRGRRSSPAGGGTRLCAAGAVGAIGPHAATAGGRAAAPRARRWG